VYPAPEVAAFIREHLVPVRVHATQQRDEFKRLGQRFSAQWTPTTLIVDASGTERHRVEGFLPAEDFLTQLKLGLGHAAFAAGDFAAAENRFREIVEKHSSTDAAAEAQYWAGVSRYKATGDANALKETARAFSERYQNTSWAKRASVWKA
jgi:TolA-binding protein